MNVQAMNEAAQHIVGTHDFRNLCKMDVGNGVVRFDRSVTEAKVVLWNSRDERSRSNMAEEGSGMQRISLS